MPPWKPTRPKPTAEDDATTFKSDEIPARDVEGLRSACGVEHQLIRDEGHRNRMTVPELERRMMKGWLASEYAAVLFYKSQEEVSLYASYREQPKEIYLRQLFVSAEPSTKRHWPGSRQNSALKSLSRLIVDVLVQNEAAVAVWRRC